MQRIIFEKLLSWKAAKGRQPLIIMGARQVGKTFILNQFGRECFAGKCHFINFEKDKNIGDVFAADLNPLRIIKELEFFLNKPIDPKTDLLVFDEIQECPSALTSLKYFAEDLPDMALCAAGSLLGLQLNPASFPVGKVNILHMHPCSFREFLTAVDDYRGIEAYNAACETGHLPEFAHKHLWDQLNSYFIVGGLPEVVMMFSAHRDKPLQAYERVRGRQQELITSYQADISKHSGKINSMHIDRVWSSVPEQLTAVQDESAPKFKFKDVVSGIRGFNRLAPSIDWLKKAGLVLQVNIVNSAQLPLKAFTKENAFKLMMFDVGILGAMASLSPQVIQRYAYGTYKGYFAENFVGQELTAAGSSELTSWRKGKAEIEFVKEFDGEVIPIEVKSGSKTKSKSLRSFSDKYAPKKKVVLSAKNLFAAKETKTHYCPIYFAGVIEKLLDHDPA